MCNAPAVSTFVRGATDVMTFGTGEIGGVSKKLGEVAGSIVPKSPVAPTTPITAADPGPVQQTKEGQTVNNDQVMAAQRAKRAAAMRTGIMATIGPNLGSIGNTTPNMPMAYATGMKTMLGA